MLKLGFVLVATFAIGCDLDDDDDSDDVADPGTGGDTGDDQQPPPDTSIVWRANMTGLGPYSTVTGTSIVTQLDERSFNATIIMRNDNPDAERPWHVHFGTCGSGGAIVGPAEAYPPLAIDDEGGAEAQTNVLFPLDRTAQYHVNVHESPEQLAVLIACGDLVLSR